MGQMVLELTEQSFEQEVLKSTQPVLVDFWAPWCGPCRLMTPVVDELAAENHGSAKVAKVNTDQAQNLATSYRVDSIPTFMVFKNGNVVERFLGPQSKSKLQTALDEAKA